MSTTTLPTSIFSEWVARGIGDLHGAVPTETPKKRGVPASRLKVVSGAGAARRNSAAVRTHENSTRSTPTLGLISEEVLQKCQNDALKGSGAAPPKLFLEYLYGSPEYKKNMSSDRGKILKRGSNAKNWCSHDGEKQFICRSLHKANNIYQALGKREWCADHIHDKPGQSDKTPQGCSWSVTLNDVTRKCMRSPSHGCGTCSQHFKLGYI